MITALSRTEIKREKRRIRREMKEFLITIKDVYETVKDDWHENSVYRSFNEDLTYWNGEVMAKAQEMINKRRSAAR